MEKELKGIRLFLHVVVLLILISIVSSTGNTSYARQTPLPLDLPGIESLKTAKGIRIFYIKDELPQLTIAVSIGLGTLYENSKDAGISELIAYTLTHGGSKKYPADRLYQAIESVGGRLAIQSSWERTIISLRVLERHAELAFDIIADLITNPNLGNEYIENARSLIIERLRREKDKPFHIAFEKAREIIFKGKGYGAVVREETINSITRDEILRACKRYFNARNIIIGISTSIDLLMIKRLLSTFDSLERGESQEYDVDYRSSIESVTMESRNIYLIPRDIPQATVVVGTVAPDIRDSGIYALEIMNFILGGSSFNSRLMREIRVKRGLSYAVQSILKFRKKTGVFLAYAQTNYEKVDVTLSLLLENIKTIAAEGISSDELEFARESINNSYVFEFNSSMNILSKFIALEYNELPASFVADYPVKINAVREKEVLEESEKLFKNGLVKVVVGKRGLKSKLERFGTVVIVEDQTEK
jgi:zinc protease